MMALQHYETIYEKIPGRIAEEATRTMKATRLTAEAQAKAAQEQTRPLIEDRGAGRRRFPAGRRPCGPDQAGELAWWWVGRRRSGGVPHRLPPRRISRGGG